MFDSPILFQVPQNSNALSIRVIPARALLSIALTEVREVAEVPYSLPGRAHLLRGGRMSPLPRDVNSFLERAIGVYREGELWVFVYELWGDRGSSGSPARQRGS